MSAPARDWLPPGAYTIEAVWSAIEEVVTAWSARWFVNGDIRISAIRIDGSARQLGSEQPDHVEGQVASFSQTGREKRQVLEAALNVSLAEESPTPADHRLLDAVAHEILEDLVGDLDRLFESAGRVEERDLISASLSLGGSEIGTVSLPAHGIASGLKTRLPRLRKGGALADRLTALGAMKVRTEAILGIVKLTIEDLQDLGQGDVLVLDRGLDDNIDLRLSDRSSVIASGRLDQKDGRISLSF